MESTSTCQKIVATPQIDRICGLPDQILGEILKLLPMREAMATCVLAKRWLNLWTFIENLCFKFSQEMKEEYDHYTFVEFVDKVLDRCTSLKSCKFDLRATIFCGTGISNVNRWITAAISRNLEKMVLDVPELPTCVFTCRSLKILYLHISDGDVVNIPDSIYLPNLKVLVIEGVLIGSLTKLFPACPVLRDLSIDVADRSPSDLVISAHVLDKLKIHIECFGGMRTIVFDTPKLCTLNIKNEIYISSYEFKSLPSLIELEVEDVYNDFYFMDVETHLLTSFTLQLLDKFKFVQYLTLHHLPLCALYDTSHFKKRPLPIFHNLTCLHLKTCQFGVLFDLLHASPKLVVLILTMEEVFEFNWIEPQEVPSCLSSCIEEMSLKGFIGLVEHEFEMMKYLLGNAEVLKRFDVETQITDLASEVNFRQKLCQFPKASRLCEVMFF